MFGTSAAIMEEEVVSGLHIVTIANFCRCRSPEMLQVLKRDSVRFVGHVAKAMKLANLVSFPYALEVLEFFQVRRMTMASPTAPSTTPLWRC